MKKAYGVVSKGNGECFLTGEKHTSLSIGGGQAGQGFPCVLVIDDDEDIHREKILQMGEGRHSD